MGKKLLFIFLFCYTSMASAQEDAWIYLTDKPNVAASIANPITILTQKAIDRKAKHGVIIDSRDVPVNETYITQLKNATGITVLAKSKWFNAVHVRGSQTDINNLSSLGFVDYIDFANKGLNSRQISKKIDKFSVETSRVTFNYGNTLNQVQMISADDLHQSDYTGSGVTVAVIDAGFPGVDTRAPFQRMRDAGNLLGGYDFVNRTTNVYASSASDHGTKVLSTMAGYVDGQFVGTAPDASYYVFLTEDVFNENPVEESYWVEAVERADSLGVDLVNTSLGYKDFDDADYNYATTDLDGNTAFITKGANIAFEKGLLLVTSAGNEGNAGVGAPADSAGTLSVGAVDSAGNYASFSSVGSAIQPTHKPDVVARGALTYVVNLNGNITQSNGTSFSSPVMAGGVACLMQALPNKTNAEIMQLIRESSSIYATPNYQLGYGIPDLQQALNQALSNNVVTSKSFRIFPNPSKYKIYISFPEEAFSASVFIYDVLGKKVFEKNVSLNNNSIDISSFSKGVYLLNLVGDNRATNTYKLIKE